MKKFISGLIIGLLISSTPFAFGAGVLFTDIESGTWYSNATKTLSKIGVIKGYEDSTFKPENNVTRAELSVMLDRYDKYLRNHYELKSASYSKDGISFEYPNIYEIHEDKTIPNLLIIEDTDGGKIEIYSGEAERTVAFEPEDGVSGPSGSQFTDIKVGSGNIINNNEINEYFFEDHGYSIENGIGMIFFGLASENMNEKIYNIHIEYTNQEQRDMFIDLLKTLKVN